VATMNQVPPEFERGLADLLNYYSVDNLVGMQDFVLAKLITRFLESMAIAKLHEKRLTDG